MDSLFFELIRIALGSHSSLSCLPSADEWDELFELAKKQSLVGICFVAIQRLGADADPSTSSGQVQEEEEIYARIGMSEETYFTWAGVAAKIHVQNELVNRQCVKVQEELKKAGIRSSILKGQAVGSLYGALSQFRQSGDIDVYVDCGREKAIEFARKLQGDVDWDYKHLHLDVFGDTKVEMHYRVEVVSNLMLNCKLQAWFNEHSEELWHSVDGLGITAPSVEFNLFYILLHAYRHFLFEGVGLRQLMDYFFVLQTAQRVSQFQSSKVSSTIERFGMMRFARGVMWIMQEVFGLEDEYLLMEPDEKEGRYILDEVMRGGNFGMHDDRHADIRCANWKVADVKRRLRHSAHLFWHYPSEAFWNPVFIVWHKVWKIMNK